MDHGVDFGAGSGRLDGDTGAVSLHDAVLHRQVKSARGAVRRMQAGVGANAVAGHLFSHNVGQPGRVLEMDAVPDSLIDDVVMQEEGARAVDEMNSVLDGVDDMVFVDLERRVGVNNSHAVAARLGDTIAVNVGVAGEVGQQNAIGRRGFDIVAREWRPRPPFR